MIISTNELKEPESFNILKDLRTPYCCIRKRLGIAMKRKSAYLNMSGSK